MTDSEFNFAAKKILLVPCKYRERFVEEARRMRAILRTSEKSLQRRCKAYEDAIENFEKVLIKIESTNWGKSTGRNWGID